MRDQPRTVIPRLLAGTGGFALAVFAGVAWYLAQLLRGLVDDGHALVTGAGTSASLVVEQSTEGMQTQAALLATSSAERFAHDMIGDAGTAVQRFQILLLVSLFAGALAIAIAVRRLPLQRWPEFAWAAAAVLALLPGRDAAAVVDRRDPLGGLLRARGRPPSHPPSRPHPGAREDRRQKPGRPAGLALARASLNRFRRGGD